MPLPFSLHAALLSVPLRLEKMRFCLCSRGLRSMTGSQKVTCGAEGGAEASPLPPRLPWAPPPAPGSQSEPPV